MYTAKEYIKPKSADEVCQLLEKGKRNRIVAGNMWLRLGRSNYSQIIDITALDLNYIKENDKQIIIGACTPLGDVEKSQIVKKNFNNMFEKVLKNIVGTQFRNTATIGGNVYQKHGFSDIITLLLALDADLVFHLAGKMKLSQYLNRQIKGDLLKEIIIEKNQQVSFACYKHTATDLSLLNAAICKSNNKMIVAVGSRPRVACAKIFDMEIDAVTIAEQFEFGTNTRASAAYRKAIAANLIEECLRCL